jgi:hypothetical protein
MPMSLVALAGEGHREAVAGSFTFVHGDIKSAARAAGSVALWSSAVREMTQDTSFAPIEGIQLSRVLLQIAMLPRATGRSA